MRLAHAADTPPGMMAKCMAQSASMSRQAQGALRTLLRMQAARRKMEAAPASADRAAWIERRVLELMAQELPEAPPLAPAVAPTPAREPTAAPRPPQWA
jgi:hypothetical protein